MRYGLVFLIVSFLAVTLSAQDVEELDSKSQIAFSPHNLSLGEQGVVIDSVLMDFSLCLYCHVPNKATAVEPLWYHEGAVRNFDLNATLPGDGEHVHPLDPSSRNCLFCHDGSLARSFPHRTEAFNPQVNLTAPEVSAPPNYNTHLFNFPHAGLEIMRPDSNSALPLNDEDQVSCNTCHDPHNNSLGKFLRVTNKGSEICMECHQMQNWSQSTHGNPEDQLFQELEEIACLQCHEIHTLPTRNKLLKADENSLCFSCHDGNVDADHEVASHRNLLVTFEKPFTHPIRINPNVDDAGYSGSAVQGFQLNGLAADRYVRCGDCHNPHAAANHQASNVLDGSLMFVEGVDALGFSKRSADSEYEICYKCHGRNQNVLPGNDVGRLFATGNTSYHPVESVGNSAYVPSLKPGWSEQSLITCSDCHGNDNPSGPQGPHGSSVPHILKAEYVDSPFSSVEENELCYECHDSRRIVEGNGFRFHGLHIQQAGYGCAACHNPHGSVDSPGLIDLNKPFIQPINGILKVEASEPGHGTCSLECHNVPHAGQPY